MIIYIESAEQIRSHYEITQIDIFPTLKLNPSRASRNILRMSSPTYNAVWCHNVTKSSISFISFFIHSRCHSRTVDCVPSRKKHDRERSFFHPLHLMMTDINDDFLRRSLIVISFAHFAHHETHTRRRYRATNTIS